MAPLPLIVMIVQGPSMAEHRRRIAQNEEALAVRIAPADNYRQQLCI
jgi:hypothetical protein